jgi:predicted ATPase
MNKNEKWSAQIARIGQDAMRTTGRLQRVKLKGFKSIQKMDLELAPLNILIGSNGAGKSNFINFFKFMNKLLDKELQLYVRSQLNGADRTLYFGRKTTEKLDIDLRFDFNGYQATLIPTTNDTFVFETENALFYDNNNLKNENHALSFGGEFESSIREFSGSTITEWIRLYLTDAKPYHFHDTSDTAKVKTSYSIHANNRLMAQGENLAAFLYNVRETTAYKKIVRTIQRVAPFFHDFIFEIEANEMIRLRWKHKGSDDYFDATMLSDGTLRFICLTTLLLQPNLPTIILLDEPELGLHPFAMQLLAAMMRSASEKTQIIASTQSVTLANQFSWKDIVVVDQIDNASNFRRLKEAEVTAWLEEYKIGDIWEMNAMGGTPE